MERAKHFVASAFKAPFGWSRQSRLQREVEATRTSLGYQEDNEDLEGSDSSNYYDFITATNSTFELGKHPSNERLPILFPSELPPRPQKKQSRFSMMKKIRGPVEVSLVTEAFALSPSVSPESNIVDGTCSQQPLAVLSESPQLLRKTASNQGPFSSLRPASSTPCLHKQGNNKKTKRTPPRSLVRKSLSPDNFLLTSVESNAQTPVAPRSASNPSEERSPRLGLVHLHAGPDSPNTNVSSQVLAYRSTPTGNSLDRMGAMRAVRRRAIRENTEPFVDPMVTKSKQSPRNSWARDSSSGNKSGSMSRQIYSDHHKTPSLSSDNDSLASPSGNQCHVGQTGQPYDRGANRTFSENEVQYPDLTQSLAERPDDPTFPIGPPSRLEISNRHATATQEQQDRELAERLQQEEDEAYDEILTMSEYDDELFDRLQNTRQSSMSRGFSESRDISIPNIDRPSQRFGQRGTRNNPIEINSDSDDDMSMDWEQPDVASDYGNYMQLDDSSDNEPTQMASMADHVRRVRSRRRLPREPGTFLSSPTRISLELSVRLRDCVVCGDSTPIADLPALANCEHRPEICVSCFASWIATELENKGWSSIKCPGAECRVILAHHEVQQYATLDVFDKYDNFSMRAALSDDPNFRWCRANCGSGQIHISGEEGNIFTCIGCGHRICVVHEDTWHEGETCEEFNYRISGQKEKDQKAQEEASEEAIGKLSKKCPGKGCSFNIEKNGGCDHMTCSRCRYEFCWECLVDFNKIRRQGNAAHENTCKYHSSRLR